MLRNVKIITSTLICVLFVLNLGCDGNDHSIRVMTFNIRYDNPGDGENAWPKRKQHVISMIRFHKADIVGFQEVLSHQVSYIDSSLKDYEWIGVGRDDGIREGEYSPVFYNKTKYRLIDEGTFWLSQTPEEVSLGWDAACKRIVTYGVFEDRSSKINFYLFNTHFDHRGENARENSAHLLLEKISQIAGEQQVIVTGDFNAEPTSVVYQILTNGSEDSMKSRILIDTKVQSQHPHHGPDGTYTGFDRAYVAMQPIDYIFIRNRSRVLYHGTLADHFNGFYPSDHYPVLAEIILN